MNRVVHFEIHAGNPERATKFYEDVFGWKVKEWVLSGPEMKEEDRYWMVMTAEEDSKEPGINGGLVFRRGPKPLKKQSVNAYVCTVGVDSVDKYVKRVLNAGGKVAMPKMAIPEVGWQAYCFDTEGNIFGVHQADENAM